MNQPTKARGRDNRTSSLVIRSFAKYRNSAVMPVKHNENTNDSANAIVRNFFIAIVFVLKIFALLEQFNKVVYAL